MKKAISMLATAGLLASLLGTSLVGTASAAVGTWTGTGNTYLATCNPTNCQQVADGSTQMQLFAPDGTTLATGYMTVTGASFAAAAGHYAWDATAGTLSITAGTSASTGDWISLKSSTAGTATVSIYSRSSIYVAGTLTGTVSVTFYAAGSAGISVANSFSKMVTYTGTAATDCANNGYTFSVAGVSSGAATIGGNVAMLCVFVGSATAGTGVGGLSVSATISPVGVLAGTAVGQAVTLSELSGGVYYAAIRGSGVAGAATITLSTTTLAGGNVALGTQTFTFTGGISKITASSFTSAADKSSAESQRVVSFKAYDAAGSRVATSSSTTTAVASTGAPFTVSNLVQTTTTASGQVWVTCRGTEGSGTVTVKYTSTDGLTTISSNAETVYCSGYASTFTVAFDKTTVIPGGSATLTATIKDAAGQPAAWPAWPDNVVSNDWLAVVSSGTLYVGPDDGDQGDGTTTWSYLAPFNTGVVTAAVTDLHSSTTTPAYTNLGTKYASLTVGAPVPIPPSVGAHVPAYSALGVTTSGPFSTSTKVAALGHFVTVKMVFGASHAGRHIQIWTQSKNSAGVWSAKAYLTTRVANSSGNVYFYWRSYSAAWWSIQGRDGTTWTNPVQTRWMR